MTLSIYATNPNPDFVLWRKRPMRLWVAALTVISAFGCRRASTDSAAPPAPKPSSPASSPLGDPQVAARARDVCETFHLLPALRKAACCNRPPEQTLVDECVRVLEPSLNARTLEIDRSRLSACRSALERALTGCAWITPGQPALPNECENIFVGALGTGAACHSSLECHAPLHCARSSAAGKGMCKPPEELGSGCGTLADPLASLTLERNLEREHPTCRDFCSPVTHRCEPTPVAGAACLASVNCAHNQCCIGGRCSNERAREHGESCGAVPCARGLRCLSGRCQPLGQAGEGCFSDFDCSEGGCVRTAKGSECGMKCSISLDDLAASKTTRFRLPARSPTNGAPFAGM